MKNILTKKTYSLRRHLFLFMFLITHNNIINFDFYFTIKFYLQNILLPNNKLNTKFRYFN